ncbi:baseplate assembly protein [Serratia rubidaea]|uniref:baseplate assembly protein n=1 Tax=Serratia rubidaea TaxID=61652 RepID=UPI0022B8EBA4|nr:baseplate J/gp47 family protein [Serratia rubidaea]WBF44441.1 baseplate J/gp47 family protein [Serratia rubidaea]
MATNSATINLSELPVPDAVKVPDAGLIFEGWLNRLRGLDPVYDALLPSDPVYKQGEVLAYHSTLLRVAMNDSIRAVLLASAKGADLDQIGANFDVARLLINPGDPNAVPPVEPVYEDDDAFRTRIQLAWSRLSTAGAENAYTFFAASADPSILDVRAYGPLDHGRRGEVDIYVLSRDNDGIPTAEVLEKVNQAVNAKDVRPMTDFVTVKPAAMVKFVVTADIYIPSGPDIDTVMSASRWALETYLEQTHRIGSRVSRSGIDRALHQPGVVTVKLASPVDDLLMDIGQAPLCTEITLKKVTVNVDA